MVTVITPTTTDRLHFNERIRELFAAQDYPNKEHLFDYDSGNIGAKRNRLCGIANGEIILHFDSDDYYAPDWISKSVKELLSAPCDMVGLSTAYFHSKSLNKTWQYVYPPHENMIGSTLCYYKSYWERNKFRDISAQEKKERRNRAL